MALSIPSAAAFTPSLTAWPQKRSLNVVPLTTKVVRYEAGQGPESHVTLQWCKGIPAKDTTTRTLSPLSKPMCLLKEEVRGQKVEHEIILPPGSPALKLIPGGVFDAQELLTSGVFQYLHWENRKPYTLYGQGDEAREQHVTCARMSDAGIHEEAAMAAVKALTDHPNSSCLPKRSACSEMCWSTSQDGMGVNISGSFFYMGLAESNQFSFSSDRFRYLYVYMFDQVFAVATAGRPSQATDLLSDTDALNEDALFLLEVKYGRRLYVVIESESALETYSHGIPGGLEWLIMAAKLQQPAFRRKVHGHINIRLQTQNGSQLEVNDDSQLQAKIDAYFRTSCEENPVSPLSYKASDLDGTPVSLLTTASLESQQSLTSPKARVQLREITLTAAESLGMITNDDIYGTINLHLFHALGQEPFRDRCLLESSHTSVPILAGAITIASKESPLRLSCGQTLTFGRHESEKYIDVDITSLDMMFHLEPIIKESVATDDLVFSTQTNLKKNLRQMLMEGSTCTTFQCEHRKNRVELTVEITPL